MNPNVTNQQVVVAINSLHSLQLVGQERHQGVGNPGSNPSSFRQTTLILLKVPETKRYEAETTKVLPTPSH